MDSRPARLSDVARPPPQSGGQGGYDQVLRYLSDQLTSGALKAGDRLLPERELALGLGVSRPVVREALRSLAMIGVLAIRQGHGTVVQAPDAENIASVVALMMSQRRGLADDILEVRIALERQAVRLACLRAGADDFERVSEAFDGIVATIDQTGAGGRADFAFHSALVEASHSTALIQLYAVVAALLERNHIQRRERLARTATYRAFLIDHHRRILLALIKRDADACERLLIEHFAIGEELNRQGRDLPEPDSSDPARP
jgi:GntR family transcriptional regulator, transcriptional repressor for pyruvate dehydrogenase complex